VLAALAAGLAWPWGAGLRAAAQASAADAPVEVEAGIYMLPGRRGPPSAENLGRVGNAGFIVGRQGLIAIDTGTSFRHGQALLAAMADSSPKPVQQVVVTQARQEFLFGAAAFQARGIPVRLQREAAGLVRLRCEDCLKALREALGDAEMQGTTVVTPDQLFDETHVLESAGRPVLVSYHGLASGPGTTSVFDVRSGTLFAGGLVDNQRIPDIQDGDVAAWRQALTGLRALQINTVVPGHGPAGPPELIQTMARYLARLEQMAAQLLKAGAALSEVPDAMAMPELSHWDQYDTLHRRNASLMFLRLERQLLLGEPTPGAKP
jgi:glyoxylase-like metal-dependent hydrolase (beta-lactamase superfamily II)